jgi:predicted nucleic acid-binding protein
MTPGLLRRAVEIDHKFSDLALGFVDAAVMAFAEQNDLPVLTFDFEDFLAAPQEGGFWRLVVDEERYREIAQ